MTIHIRQSTVNGVITIPPSKSHTIRALLIAALAEGESTIVNYLDSDDTRACIHAIQQFGAQVGDPYDVRDNNGQSTGYKALTVKSLVWQADAGIHHNMREIDVGNSGTTLFLTAGIAALFPESSKFTGDAQIQNRSAENLLAALRDLGAAAHSSGNNGCAPFIIRGPLHGGHTEIECPSSQYLSSLMLATPLMSPGTVADIHIPLLYERPYAEMTEWWLKTQNIEFKNWDWKHICIHGGQHYTHFRQTIAGDFSSATFFACAVAIGGGSLLLRGLDMADSQGDKAVFSILQKMGCTVEQREQGIWVSESTDQQASHSLRGGEFDLNAIPDALPALAITAAFAQGETRLVNVPHARIKETDRIRCMSEELGKMGIQTEELPDGLVIHGGRPQGATLDGHGDHRIIMACAIAGLAAQGGVSVLGAEAVTVTFPTFFTMLQSCTQSQCATTPINRVARPNP